MANRALLNDGIKGNYAAALATPDPDEVLYGALNTQMTKLPGPVVNTAPTPPAADLMHDGIRGNGAAAAAATPAPAPPPTSRPAVPTNAPAPPPTQAYNVAPYKGAPATSNTQGFVQGKLDNDTLGTSHKYEGGRYLAQHPGDVQGLVQQPGFEGWTVVGSDKIKGPGGSVYDVRNANGAVQWTAVSGPAWDKNGIPGVNSLGVNSSMANDGIKGNYAAANAAASDAAGAAGTSRFGYAGAGTPAPAAAAPAPAAPGRAAVPMPKPGAPVEPVIEKPVVPLPREMSSARVSALMNNGNPYQSGQVGPTQDLTDDSINEGIMRLLARGEKPVDRAAVEDQYSPVAAVMQRNAQRQKASAAERGAFQGTNIGGAGGSNDAEARQIDEATGMQQGQLMAQLIGSEMTQRRGDVQAALAGAQGAQKIALERQLSLIDAEIRRMGLEQQNQQFYDNMGYNIGRDEYNDSAAFNNGLA